jgi:hypothetical protein
MQCTSCKLCTLVKRHRDYALSISLRDFHLKRGDNVDQRPIGDLASATQLIDCLHKGRRPPLATLLEFGILKRRHFEALQDAMIHGVTAYDLDRVLGDGPAITWLVNGALCKRERSISFTTVYDPLVGNLLSNSSS